MEPGLYRYLALEHKLHFIHKGSPNLAKQSVEACYNQDFVGKSAVVFVWTTIPYRTEWRYSFIGHKDIAIEAGHLCQNLYLTCEAIEAGTCAIAAYDQNKLDTILGVDGEDEFTIYLASVGKKLR